MIRRLLRFGFRLGLLAGIGLALFKLVQGRRAAEVGSPSPDWAPAPAPNPNLPRTPPEPELVKPAMLEEIVEKKKATVPAEPVPAPAAGESVVKKKAPAKKAPAKKAAPKKAAAKKTAAAQKTPVAKKTAPVKKATKKQP